MRKNNGNKTHPKAKGIAGADPGMFYRGRGGGGGASFTQYVETVLQ